MTVGGEEGAPSEGEDPDGLTISVPADESRGMREPASLRGKARVGGRWGLFVAVLQQLGSVAATIVLARQLLPLDFGIVALTYSVISVVRVIADAGLGTALVAREKVDRRVESSTFWLSALIGVGAGAGAALLAVPVARLGGLPAAAPYIAVGASQIFSSLVLSVVRGILLRDLQYRLVYAADAAGVLVYVSVQIVLALTTDLGAWVVVIGWLADQLATAAVLVVGSRWRPTRHFSMSDLRSDIGFNAIYTATMITNAGAKNIDNLFVGRTMGATALGNYYIAFALPNILRQRLTSVGAQVILPILSRIERAHQRQGIFLEYTQMVAFLAVPALVGIALLADPVVRLFFGPTWVNAIPPLRIVALAAAFELLSALSIPVFLAARRPGMALRVNVARLVLLSAGLVVVAMAHGSLRQVAAAILVSAVMAAAISVYDVCRLTGLPVRALAGALAPVVLSTVFMAVVVAGVDHQLLGVAAPLRLTAGAAAGCGAYLAAGFVAFRQDFRLLIHEAWRFVGGGKISTRAAT